MYPCLPPVYSSSVCYLLQLAFALQEQAKAIKPDIYVYQSDETKSSYFLLSQCTDELLTGSTVPFEGPESLQDEGMSSMLSRRIRYGLHSVWHGMAP